MCIGIVKIWFEIVNGQVLLIFRVLPTTDPCLHLRMILIVIIDGFSPNLVCALILWRSTLGMLMGKFCLFLTSSHLPGTLWLFIPRHTIVAGYYGFTLVVHESVHSSVRFSFPDDNLSKRQWIFTKLGMCIPIVEFWFGIASGQISSIFDSYLPKTRPYFRFRTIT